MRFSGGFAASALAFVLVACSDGGPDAARSLATIEGDGGEVADAMASDAPAPSSDAAHGEAGDAAKDADANACEWGGAPGHCMTASSCKAIADRTPYASGCGGDTGLECCIKTPSTADNPPIPPGYKLLQQSQVTPDMTKWAVAILDDPMTYPMFSTTTKTFGTLTVLARVEWHPPDFQNNAIHRGVTLYEPA